MLHPPTLDDMGLSSALREYVDQFTASSGAIVNLDIPGELGRFNRSLEITVFRIVEEALSNLYPQSGGAFIAVRLSRSATTLMVEIQSHQAVTFRTDGMSRADTEITGIHERAIEHGGTVHFKSDPSGTLLSVTLPLGNHQESAN